MVGSRRNNRTTANYDRSLLEAGLTIRKETPELRGRLVRLLEWSPLVVLVCSNAQNSLGWSRHRVLG